MDSIEIREKPGKLKSRLARDFHVTEIGLFGSYCTGEADAGSDIDILVDFEKGHKGFFNYIRLKSFLEETFGKEVDLVMKGAVRPDLKDAMLNRVIYA